jgi:hypothetical protein
MPVIQGPNISPWIPVSCHNPRAVAAILDAKKSHLFSLQRIRPRSKVEAFIRVLGPYLSFQEC